MPHVLTYPSNLFYDQLFRDFREMGPFDAIMTTPNEVTSQVAVDAIAPE
ncbi:hypothetical protein [Novipirellula galeiformis]|nr:hypothetical protein [Novipirellula galeiformis]